MRENANLKIKRNCYNECLFFAECEKFCENFCFCLWKCEKELQKTNKKYFFWREKKNITNVGIKECYWNKFGVVYVFPEKMKKICCFPARILKNCIKKILDWIIKLFWERIGDRLFKERF